MFSESLSRRTVTLFFFAALIFSLSDISKVFIVPHCLAFDVNDDANHTFVNLQQWRRILSQGEWPMMNVYNNFGTPLIGDVLTYPLSPLALTYVFLPGPQAMTINRLMIGLFTLFLLFIFYHRRLPLGLSIGLGICTFYAPGFLWHSNHHHFQLSLLLLTAIFLLQEKFTKRMSVSSYIGICALSIIMFMSVSLNVVLILCLLITGYQWYLSDGPKDKSLLYILSALLCGVIAIFPDILLFLQATSRSMRGLAEYPVVSFFGPNKIFLTPIVAAGIYSIALFREKRYKEVSIVFGLGVIPYCIVLLSRVMPSLWNQIPLLGATDVVRLTWGASIFLMIGCGGLLLRWLQLTPGWRWEIFVCLLATAMDAHSLPFRQEWFFIGRLFLTAVWGVIFIVFGCCMMGAAQGRIKEITIARWMVGFISGAVLMFYLYYGFFDVLGFSFPQICHVTGRGAFSLDGSQEFTLPKACLVIPKNSRVAYDFNTIVGLDLRGATEGLFGAGARSTIMTNEEFSVGLFNKGLIRFDNYTGDYHFSPPWQAKELQKLGVSYVVQGKKDKALQAQGWKLMGEDKGAFIYQNPLPTGVVYFKKEDETVPVVFNVVGNGINIQLPASLRGESRKLVISLLRIPGWRAWIDDKEVKFIDSENKFLVLPVSPNDHIVRVRYVPISPRLILLSLLFALSLPWVLVKTLLPIK